MAFDALFVSWAFFIGAFSFFSPCSVGLLPAYVGFHLANMQTNDKKTNSTNVSFRPARPVPATVWAGTKLGLGGAAGFFVLFLLMGALVLLIPLPTISPALPYLAILVGAALIGFGVLSLAGRGVTVRLPQVATAHPLTSIFAFGFAYSLASVGCTFPLFASVALGPISTGRTLTGALGLLAYATGMALVFILATIALAVSRQGASRFLSRATPFISKVAAVAMIAGGTYIIYWWAAILEP